MLKRDGELCRHKVPGFPGLLTDSEQKAYAIALAAVEEKLRDCIERTNVLAQVEKQMLHLADFVSMSAKETQQTVRAVNSEWQIHRMLSKSESGELLLCSRQTGQGAEFGLLERFAKDSHYAEILGEVYVTATHECPAFLMQAFLNDERYLLPWYRDHIDGIVEQTLCESNTGIDCSRVMKAISARCRMHATEGTKNAPQKKQTAGVHTHY